MTYDIFFSSRAVEIISGLFSPKLVSTNSMRIKAVIIDPGHGGKDPGAIGSYSEGGNQVQLMVTMPDPRCVMTTLPQNGLSQDMHVLRALVEHNRLDIMGSGRFPCSGVYAVVVAGGSVGMNDPVALGE